MSCWRRCHARESLTSQCIAFLISTRQLSCCFGQGKRTHRNKNPCLNCDCFDPEILAKCVECSFDGGSGCNSLILLVSWSGGRKIHCVGLALFLDRFSKETSFADVNAICGFDWVYSKNNIRHLRWKLFLAFKADANYWCRYWTVFARLCYFLTPTLFTGFDWVYSRNSVKTWH